MRKKVLYILPIDESGMNRIREEYDVIVTEDAKKETILKYVSEADALVTRLSTIDADVINAGKKLKAIAKHGAGVNNIDVKLATEKGITVLTTGNVNSRTVAEHVILAMGAVAKKISYFDKEMHRNNWDAHEEQGVIDLYRKKLGIIGFGNLGKLVGQMASKGFGMDVMVYARPHHKEQIEAEGYTYISELDDLCRTADFLTLHITYNESTVDLIDKRRLELMKPTAILINFARGGIVNEYDLAEALEKGVIAGAAVDVFEQEPPDDDFPLLKLDNVLLSPHIAYSTVDARRKMSMQVAEGIDDVLNGRVPRFAANKKELYGV